MSSTNTNRNIIITAHPGSYHPLLAYGGVRGGDGGLADGLGHKLRAGCLGVPVFVSLALQPVRLDLHIALQGHTHTHTHTHTHRFWWHTGLGTA